jgi:regulator of sigma E protease
MLQNILIFILFLCPLILIHEVGHFLMAILFGVKVEVFSIGFGPRLVTLTRKGTDFIISLIPFGGYVKMFGEDISKKDEISLDLRGQSYLHKGKFARFMIAFGGPLFNFILAYVLYFGLFVHGEYAPALRFGVVADSEIFTEIGIVPGDIILKINDVNIVNLVDLPTDDDEMINTITVKRDEEERVLDAYISVKQFMAEFEGMPRGLRSAVVVDRNGKKYTFSPSEEVISDFSIDLPFNQDTGFLIGEERYGVIVKGDLVNSLVDQGFYPVDLVVERLIEDSAAQGAIEVGDIIVSINDHRLTSFLEIKKEVSLGNPVVLRVLRQGRALNFKILPKLVDDRYLVGIVSAGEYLPPLFIDFPAKGPIDAMTSSFRQVKNVSVKVLMGLKKMITGRVSAKQIGGPLSIGKMAADSFKMSWSYFLQIMALISVNLGLLNLLPIPVLDGGHILFVCLELINRGPLSHRKVELAQIVGTFFILTLSVLVMFNDIYRILVK